LVILEILASIAIAIYPCIRYRWRDDDYHEVRKEDIHVDRADFEMTGQPSSYLHFQNSPPSFWQTLHGPMTMHARWTWYWKDERGKQAARVD